MYKRKGNLQLALDYYEEANMLYKEDLYSLINLASLRFILKGEESSKELINEILRIGKRQIEKKEFDYWTYICMAQAFIFLNDSSESKKYYQSAIDMSPPIQDLVSEYEHLNFLIDKNIKKNIIENILKEVLEPILK